MVIVKFVGFDYMSNGLVAEIKRNITALEIYEPRAELRDVTIEASVQGGHIKNIYLIGPNTEYEAESEEREDAEDTGEE